MKGVCLATMNSQSPPCPHLNNIRARVQTVVLREVGEVELLQDGAIGAVRGHRRGGGFPGVSAGMWLINLMCSSSPGCDVGLPWRLLSAVPLTGATEPGQARSISKLKMLHCLICPKQLAVLTYPPASVEDE